VRTVLGMVVRRLLTLVPLMLAIIAFIFLVMALSPNNAAISVLGNQASPDQIAAFNHEHGLDQPLPVRYLRYLGGLLHGDWGTTFSLNEPVGTLIHVQHVSPGHTGVGAGVGRRPLPAQGTGQPRHMAGGHPDAPSACHRDADRVRRLRRRSLRVACPNERRDRTHRCCDPDDRAAGDREPARRARPIIDIAARADPTIDPASSDSRTAVTYARAVAPTAIRPGTARDIR